MNKLKNGNVLIGQKHERTKNEKKNKSLKVENEKDFLKNHSEFKNMQYIKLNTHNSEYFNNFSPKIEFVSFKSKNNISFFICLIEKDIICYDINSQVITTIIKNVHQDSGFDNTLNYLYDKKNNRDLILLVYCNNAKIFDIYNWSCISNLSFKKNIKFLKTAHLIEYHNEICIVNSSSTYKGRIFIVQIINLKGSIIKKIEIKENINDFYQNRFLDVIYDKNLKKYFIIASNLYFPEKSKNLLEINQSVESIDIKKNKIFHKYNISNTEDIENEIYFLEKNNNQINLIELVKEGKLYIWNFHTGELIKAFNFDVNIKAICLWNNNYIFIKNKKNIYLFDLKNEKIFDFFHIEAYNIFSFSKANHRLYGDCLIISNFNVKNFSKSIRLIKFG